MKITDSQIRPEKVTKPIQLLAVWFVALLLLTNTFLTFSTQIDEPTWIRPLLVISGIILVIFIVVLVFLMQTKYRPEMLSGNEYLQYLDKKFQDFKPENLSKTNLGIINVATIHDNNVSAKNSINSKSAIIGTLEPEILQDEYNINLSLEEIRVSEYKNHFGLFLIHSWRPSKLKGQVADIRIKLFQHKSGPLNLDQIESVEYELGPLFFKEPVIKTNKENDFALDISAYGPMLCVAKVNLKTNDPIILKRYIDFDY
jgi:hypothetical protein